MMDESQKVIIAKQIKQFFFLVLIAGSITILVFFILFIWNKPPINPPIPQETLNRIREQQNSGSSIIQVGSIFKTHSKYDSGIALADILYINEIRSSRFKNDMIKKMSIITPWVFIILIFGFYLLKGVKWVIKFSDKEIKN